MLIGISWLLASCFLSFSVFRAWGSQSSLEVLVRHTLLRELVSSDRWVIPVLGLRHARIHLSDQNSFLTGVIDASGSRDAFDVAVRCADQHLVALFSWDGFFLSSYGISKVVHFAASFAFASNHWGVRSISGAAVVKIRSLFDHTVGGSLLLQGLGTLELQLCVVVLVSLNS